MTITQTPADLHIVGLVIYLHGLLLIACRLAKETPKTPFYPYDDKHKKKKKKKKQHNKAVTLYLNLLTMTARMSITKTVMMAMVIIRLVAILRRQTS